MKIILFECGLKELKKIFFYFEVMFYEFLATRDILKEKVYRYFFLSQEDGRFGA